MQTKPKENSVITTRLTDDGQIEFNVMGAGAFTFNPASASEANRRRAELHGWVQRISDKAAKGRDPKTGKAVDPQVKFDAMKGLANWYEAGGEDWRMVGERGPRRDELGEILLDALELAYPNKSRDDLQVWLGKRSKAEKANLLIEPRIAKIIAELREGAADSAGDMLAELED